MADAKSVITQVMQGNYPPNWRVYYGHRGCLFFWSQRQSSILVILPKGVVQCDANDLEKIYWLYFPDIDRIELAQETNIESFDGDISTETDYWLDIYYRDGSYLKWWINSCFGDTASIGKSIIAAYRYYWQYNRF